LTNAHTAGRTLLIVDGTNVVMRCAFGGEIEAERAIRVAFAMITRATREVLASHLVVTFDHESPTWRKELEPTYKATRTSATADYSKRASEHFTERGMYCVSVAGFEADDCVATIAARANTLVAILSGDSDLSALISETVRVYTPGNPCRLADLSKYGEGVTPSNLADYKALVGERGDNIAGVPGIGPKKAAQLLATHGSIEQLLAQTVVDTSREAARVRASAESVRLALRLVTLRTDVPIPPISPTNSAVTGISSWGDQP
jgi:DNA polymerase I